MPHPLTPAQAWSELLAGNARFVRGEMDHPSQGIEHRTEVSTEQHPFAVILGCSDSRVAAELIFDRGLGDLFVVRVAGHVIDTTVLGSIEFGVDLLHTPLVIVLGHDSCGAVGAAATALQTGVMPSGFVRGIVDGVIPSIIHTPGPQERAAAAAAGPSAEPVMTGVAVDPTTGVLIAPTPKVLGQEHVRHTVQTLLSYSASLAEAVAAGRCAVVGLEYDLADGRVHLIDSVGALTTEDTGLEPVAG